MNDEDKLDKFERFWREQLDEPSHEAFIKDLEENPALKAEYEDFVEAATATQMSTISELKRQMVQPKKRQLGRNLLSWAASLLILIALGSTIWMRTVIYSNHRLVEDHLRMDIVDHERATVPRDQLFDDIHEKLLSHDYVGALALMPTVDDTVPYFPYLLYIRGLTAVRSDSVAQAFSPLKKLVEMEDPRFSEEAQWNLALAYLKNSDEEACHQELRSIISRPNHDYYMEAKNLSDQLNSLWRLF